MWSWLLACQKPEADALLTWEPPAFTVQQPLSAPPDADGDGSPDRLDCDDADPLVYPGAPDRCGDDRVTDCDRTSDDGLVTLLGRASYTDLSQALAAAVPGDELLLCPGIYLGPYTAHGITLTGHAGHRETHLYGFDDGPVLSTSGDAVLQGLSLMFGEGIDGGAIHHEGPGHLLVRDCQIERNHADRGGGIAIFGGSLALESTNVWANGARQGGGLYAEEAWLELGDAEVSDNDAVEAGGGGWLQDSTLFGGVFSGNSALEDPYTAPVPFFSSTEGGNLAVRGDCALHGSSLRSGLALEGGGIHASGEDCQLELHAVELRSNGHPDYGTGGGLYASSCAVELLGGSAIASNQALAGGGVVLEASSLSGGVLRDNASSPWGFGGGAILVDSMLEDVIVTGNRSTQGGGLALWAHNGLHRVEISDNVADEGGGLYVFQGLAHLEDSAVVRNVTGDLHVEDGTFVSIDSDWGKSQPRTFVISR